MTTDLPGEESRASRRNSAEAHWMPFTPHRAFRKAPRRFVAASGVHYTSEDGRSILDAMAGLWCVNLGHGHPRITEAIRDAVGRLDYVSSFRMGHPAADEYAEALVEFAPDGMSQVLFTNSGSEAVDSALKIARAYHDARGDTRRLKFIGRAKGYHGMGWGGLSVSGIGRHKREFGPGLGGVAHLRLPNDDRMKFTIGQPEAGAEYAQELEELLQLHNPETVAAVIVEPVTGSGGVYPPPKGYLEGLRKICDTHGVLLIFDEVITGFNRVGSHFAAQHFGVLPDLMTCAKGLTNGAVPMGAVLVRDSVFDTFMQGPEESIELFHGYTYSAHPLACAAGLATLEVHRDLDIAGRVTAQAPRWAQMAQGLAASPGIRDIRTIGILTAIDLNPLHHRPAARGGLVADRCFERGVLIRNAGDTLLLSPPLIIAEEHMAQVFETIAEAVDHTASA